MAAVDERRVTLTSAEHGIELEGRLHLPAAAAPAPAAVICHPYPPGGGTMHFKVVRAIALELAERGAVALRFNFRGVGASSGTFDHGRGEALDVAGAVDWLAARPEVDATRLALAGYSFGATMVLEHASRDPRPRALALIGLPIGWYPRVPAPDERPWLLVAGDADPFCPLPDLERLITRLTGEVPTADLRLEVIRGTGHFFGGLESEVAELVGDFFAEAWAGRGAAGGAAPTGGPPQSR